MPRRRGRAAGGQRAQEPSGQREHNDSTDDPLHLGLLRIAARSVTIGTMPISTPSGRGKGLSGVLLRRAVVAVCAALLIAGCGGVTHSSWSHLRSVRVTVAQPGLPPPFGAPKTTSFTTPTALANVTRALNAHHIDRSSQSSSPGCAGGFTVLIVIVPQQSAPVRLTAYRCAGQTTGDVGGDLTGFLSAIDVQL